MRLHVAVFLCIPFYIGTIWAAPVSVKSPDGQIEFIAADAGGRLSYTVTFKGNPVIESSPLGISVGGADLGAGATLGAATRSSVDETYPRQGVHAVSVNRCNVAVIDVAHPSQHWTLEARVFDDGVGFRYVVPGSGNRNVTGEATGFTLPQGTKLWWQPMMIPGYRYEKLYNTAATDIAALPVGTKVGAVMTAELAAGGYAAFTEAEAVNTPGMYYLFKGNRLFQSVFTLASWPMADTALSTWRIIMIAADLNGMVNSDLVRNVNPPVDPSVAQADWIKPGRAVWNWVQNQDVSFTNMKRYSDCAGKLGFEYNTVDAGWEDWANAYTLIKQLVDYSKPLGVKIFVWKRWTEMDTPDKRKTFFTALNQAGVVGIKVDGIDSEGQVVNQFLSASDKDAAQYHIMVLWHGCPKPTGLERTWPNEIGREAIRGMENKPPWAPSNTTFPFTRLLAGNADFTPLVLNMPTKTAETSWPHQIATMISYTASILNLAGDPQSFLDNPAVEFIKSVPSTWDETVVLPQSKIGDLLMFARRKGDAWFVSVLNGNVTTGKQVTLDLSFLGAGNWGALTIKDRPDSALAETIDSGTVTSSSSYAITLRAGGGWAGRFVNPQAVADKPAVRNSGSVNRALLFWPGRLSPLLMRQPRTTLRLFDAEGKGFRLDLESPETPMPAAGDYFLLSH